MRIKAMIVDDDRIELEQFKESIDWESLKCDIVAETFNGNIAYDLYQKLKPDLIITDIEMPGLSGIGLAEKIRKIDLKTRIVFLSSYEKFEYAHSGYRLEISDYILKQAAHIEKSYDKLMKIRQEIVLARQLDEKELLARYIQNPHETLTNIFENNLFSAVILFQESTIPLFEYHSGGSAVSQRVENTLVTDEIEQENLFLIPVLNDGAFVIKAEDGSKAKRPDEYLDILCLDMLDTLNAKFHTNFYIIKLCCSKSIQEVRMLFYAVKNHFNRRYFYDNNSIITLSDHDNRGDAQVNKIDYEILQECNQQMDAEALSEYLDILFQPILLRQDYEAFCDAMNTLCFDLIQNTEDFQDKEGSPFRAIFEEKVLSQLTSVTKAIQFIKEQYRDYYTLLREKRVCNYSGYVEDTMRYVHKNLHDTTMNTDKIADHIMLSTTRLRTVFREETGQTLHQYITDVKIEKAKKLLSDNKKYKLDYIAQQVGYLNGKYLSRVFKRELGITPEEYKAKNKR